MHIDAWSATGISILVGFVATVVGFPLALSVGWLLARKDFWGKSLMSALLLAPLALPPVVVGLALLRTFGRASAPGRMLHSIGIDIPFTLAGVIAASVLVGLPLYAMATRDAIRSTDRRIEEVALAFGKRPWQVFWRITFPSALPGIASGALLAFARALGEFGATAVISGNIEGKTRTLSLAIYALLDTPGQDSKVTQLAVTSALLALATVLAYEALARWQERRASRDDAR